MTWPMQVGEGSPAPSWGGWGHVQSALIAVLE